MAFKSVIVSEDSRLAVIAPQCKGKGEMTECKSYRDISLLSLVGKIYAGNLVDRIRSVTEVFDC